MNQEIQQSVTENKKPRMYVSWWIVVIDFLVITVGGVFFATDIYYENINNPGISKDSTLMMAIIVWMFMIGGAILLISSVFKKPRWYIQKYIVSSMFAGVTFLVFLLVFLLSWKAFFVDSFVFSVLTSLLIGTCISVFINSKFQKSGFELGI